MQTGNLDLLAFGHDHQLISSRRLILQRAGYTVLAVEEEGAFRASLIERSPRVSLFCQTIEPGEFSRCEAFARKHCPSVLPMVFFNQRCKCIPRPGGVLLRSSSGPAFFLETVAAIMERSHSADRAAETRVS